MSDAGLYNQRVGNLPRIKNWKYMGWGKGENSYAEDNETRDDEAYELHNAELVGKSSVRLPRRGHRLFTTISGRTNFNGWGVYKDPKVNTNLLLSMWDGHLYKTDTSGVSTEIDNTKTWDADAIMRGVQVREFFYFGNQEDYMAKTDGSTVTQWDHVDTTVLNSLTLTGSGDDTLYAVGITISTDTGETEISNTLDIFAPSLSETDYLTINFDRKTDTAIRGYNVYLSINGGTFLFYDFIDQPSAGATVDYIIDGSLEQSFIYEAPTFNTTGGVKSNIYAKYANTLFVSGNAEEPDAVFYGGTGAMWESFSPDANGGWIKIGRGDGEKVTAMIGFAEFLFIFKENSIWRFDFGGDGGPAITSVIPQYGTSSPDSVWRMEKDVVYLGTDGRFRILGYEPTQLNVIRTTDISNRIQNKLDALDKTNLEQFFGIFFEQKYIICDGESAFPYDRRYIGFLGKWTNYTFKRFIVWDKGTKQQKLYAAESGGKIQQVLVNNTYDDNGTTIDARLRVKRIDGGDDTYLKFFQFSKIKLKNPRGQITLSTYKDGEAFVDALGVNFDMGGGVDEYMFDEPMFDESVSIDAVSDALQIIKKDLYFEAYSIYHTISVLGNSENHCLVQTMNGVYETEDFDYDRDENIV